VDRLAVLQEAIDRAQHAATRYGAEPGGLEISGADILTSRHTLQFGWTAGVLQRLILAIAEDHDGCPDVGCRTCEAIREGLATSLTGLRGMQQEELEARVSKASPNSSWWRLGL
jgi:hypothetical protein